MTESNWKIPQYISPLPIDRLDALFPRNLVILGSTGSIGRSTLAVLENLPPNESGHFQIKALAGGKNISLLAEQAARHRPAWLAVQDETLVAPLRERLPNGYKPEILAGKNAYAQLAKLDEAHLVLSAQVGAAGLGATLAAARAGKIVALANKESLVLAGDLMRSICSESGAVVLPVDSEHNALFQLLMERLRPEPVKLWITASGGPFRGRSRQEIENVTPEAALKHPNWSMGAKISIDSATLMNKGLEVIEAHHLYGLPAEQIDVVVHSQSIVHSLGCFKDGSHLAQLGTPDMRMPIAHALGWPRRIESGAAELVLTALPQLTFTPPDLETFPCLSYAYEAMRRGNGLPVILNAANEIAVDAFLNRRLTFPGIADLILAAMENVPGQVPNSEEAVIGLDQETRRWCLGRLNKA